MDPIEPSLAQESDNLTRLIREHAEAEVVLQAHLIEKAAAIIDTQDHSGLLHSTQQQLLASEDGQRQQAITQSVLQMQLKRLSRI